jgi:hypothetical protein
MCPIFHRPRAGFVEVNTVPPVIATQRRAEGHAMLRESNS